MRDAMLTGIILYWCILGTTILVVHTIENPTVARDVPRKVERRDPYVYIRKQPAVGTVPGWFAQMTADALEKEMQKRRGTQGAMVFRSPYAVARF